ncbi:MAG: ATP-dependent DNA helicase RecQ [Candidatus Eisenbacteria bacterium]|nr:ATP-dependent DNA helicase RecQ [Candidatus Eisenbacteria bacterium]
MLDPGAPAATRFADPQQVLESVFGFRSFRPGQRQIIEAVLAGRDCIGVMPTGAGKSLTFQVPAKILSGAVLVISPLISLMKDQVDALTRLGFRAAVINSTLDFEERRERLAQLRRGELELVYVAPEGLEGSLREIIAACRVSLVVVDEAHCISHWGHDFRPAYRQLQDLKGRLGGVPVLALTATATRRVAADIIQQLGMERPEGFKGSFFRANLLITAQKKGDGRNSRRDILGMIRRHHGESGIVYCLARKSVDALAEWLRLQGVSALPYHAGLDDATRHRHQDAFARDECDVIVATVAFGMGIDKSNVRFVIHRDMPKSVEAWYQEIGRAGRDGLASDCVLLYSWADVMGYDAFLDGIEDPELRAETREKTVGLFRLVDRGGCRHQKLVRHFDEEIAPCGESCDVCRGVVLDDLVAAIPRRGASAPGARAAAGSAPFARAGEGIANPELFERLRALRKRLADAEGVPAYIVFSDAVLRQMAQHVPKSRTEMLALSGVGPVKLERYGAAFLEALREA